MFNLWKLGTMAFLLQALIGLSMYAATGTSDAAVFVTIGIFSGIILIYFNHLVAEVFGITLLTFFALIILPANVPLSIVLLLIAAILVAGAARKARKEGAQESLLLLSIVVLPFGIGTVVGGPILAYRWLRDRKVT